MANIMWATAVYGRDNRSISKEEKALLEFFEDLDKLKISGLLKNC